MINLGGFKTAVKYLFTKERFWRSYQKGNKMNIAGTLELGLIYAILAMGIYVSFRIMHTPDLTVDGSFTLGLAVSAVLSAAGAPIWGLIIGAAGGAGAGGLTGFLQTKAGIHPLLAGILTMTGLYSVNLAIMGGSPNVTLLNSDTVFKIMRSNFISLDKDATELILCAVISALCICVLIWFFKTGAGLRIRATGDNDAMVRASSINSDIMKLAALSISNAFVGLSGAVLAQYQDYADINAGTGIIVVGLASVIIGEVIIRKQSVAGGLFAALIGAVVYRFLIALALKTDFFPAYMLRLVSAVIVAVTLSIPRIRELLTERRLRKENRQNA